MYLAENEIADITPLQNLTKLEQLDVKWNLVTDYTCVEFVRELNQYLQ